MITELRGINDTKVLRYHGKFIVLRGQPAVIHLKTYLGLIFAVIQGWCNSVFLYTWRKPTKPLCEHKEAPFRLKKNSPLNLVCHLLIVTFLQAVRKTICFWHCNANLQHFVKGYVDRSLPASSVEGRYHRCIKRKVLGKWLEHWFPLSSAREKQWVKPIITEGRFYSSSSQIERIKSGNVGLLSTGEVGKRTRAQKCPLNTDYS